MHQYTENNRDRVLKAYCHERLKGLHHGEVAPAVNAARKNPWHGAGWADGVEALVAKHGEPYVNEVWGTCLEYLREQRR
jgi:hypothetical protein